MNSQITLSAAQQRVVAHAVDPTAGPLLIAGGPGTGKTTALVACLAEQVAGGRPLSEMLVLTATRPLAQGLRTQVMQTIGGAQTAPRIMTAHAFARAIIRDAETPDSPEWTLLTAPEQEFRLRELLGGHDSSHWPEDLQQAATTRAFAAEVRASTARVRQMGLDPEDVAEIGRVQGRPEWQVLGEFMAEYLDVSDATASMDYAELVHRARLVLLDPQTARSIADRTPLVFVDDLTELDDSQVQMLADLVGVGCRLIGFADPSTSVYGFRGASGLALSQFESIFSGAGVLAERVTLEDDLGHAPAVSSALAALAARLPRNDHVPLPVPVAAEASGRVEAWVTDSSGAETSHIVDAIRKAHLVDGLPWHDIAVITRSQRGGLLAIARALTAAGVPVQIAGSDTALREAAAVRPLLLALRVVLARARDALCTPDEAVTLLRSPLGGLDSLGTRRLGRHLRAAHADESVSSGEWFARLLAGAVGEEDLGTPEGLRAAALAERVRQAAELVVQGADASRTLWALWHESEWARRLEEEALAGGDGAAAAHRDIDAVRALFDLAAKETGARGARAIDLLLSEVEAHEIPADTQRPTDIHARGVQLLSAHRAKGRRWPMVVVAQVQEGTWPATRRAGSVLDVSRLTRDGVAPPEPYAQLINAERRSFLLACSRATQRLVVTAAQGHEGEADQYSRFLDDLGVAVETRHGRPADPVTLPMMVAQLRLTSTDPSASVALREAAAVRLAQLGEMVDARGRSVVRGARPEDWWATRELTRAEAPVVADGRPVELHGSELVTLLTCPRQWFLQRRARGEAGRSTSSSVGSVLHTLVRHAAEEGLEVDELVAHLDTIWEDLQFEARWLSASERAEAVTQIERYARWAADNPRTVLGVEVDFDVELVVGGEHVRLRGQVDRLELGDDGVHIVDFKSGRRARSAAEVAADPQLGLYQIAAAAGAFAACTDRCDVAGGELVYLRVGSEFPKVIQQPSLATQPSLPGEDIVVGPTWMHDRLVEAARTIREERFEARLGDACRYCAFVVGCPARVNEGASSPAEGSHPRQHRGES